MSIAPREAALCGLPVVVTDFCGLHSLAASMPWGGVSTYPTFLGPRFSLHQFRALLMQAATGNKGACRDYRASVITECDPKVSKARLQKALVHLMKMPLKNPPDIDTAEKQARIDLMRYADERIVRPFMGEKERIPRGALVGGLGVYDRRFSYYSLFQALQGMYTTIDEPYMVEAGTTLRGFFPIALCKEQQSVVEFGFPGPRMRQCDPHEWKSLIACVKAEGRSEITVCPVKKDEIRLAQDLVDLGYIVPDFY